MAADLAPGGAPVLAVDIGGTKIEVGVVSADGEVLVCHRAPTGADPWPVLDALVERTLGEDLAPADVGVGCGGPMRPGGEAVSPLNIPAWRGFPLRARLAERTGLPVHVDNDAKAFALAEGWLGAAAGERNFLAMVVSTGVGGGIVLDGRLLHGDASNAGHVGHLVVEPNGRPCSCGGAGCLEAEASGTALAAITGRPAAEAPPELRVRTGVLVGRAVAAVAVLLDLQLAVVAGSVALGFGDVFFDAANAELARVARIGYVRGAVVRPAGLGDRGPLVGAAAVALAGRPRRPDPTGG